MAESTAFGRERLSKDFVEDLKALLALKQDQIEELARLALRYATDRQFDSDALAEALADCGVDSASGERIYRILHYCVQELWKGDLPTDEGGITRGLTALGIQDPEGKNKFVQFVTILSSESDKSDAEAARIHSLRTGCPSIQSAKAACDLRCIFELAERKGDDEAELPPGRLLGVEPVILLEIVSSLNEQ